MTKVWSLIVSGMVLITGLGLMPASEKTEQKSFTVAPPDEKKMPGLLAGRYGSESAPVVRYVDSIYNNLHLEAAGLSRNVFYTALRGYSVLNSQGRLRRPGLLTICDYSQSSSKKRLYVLDLNRGRILYNTYVAHGRNTGNDMATSFSNSNSSHKSSLGFMITSDTYVGGNGYSMHFDGMEKGINCQVRPRAVVMHGSDYVSAERAANHTMMGRSWGCPAVSQAEARTIIDAIKGGSCFFAYSTDISYAQHSSILRTPCQWAELGATVPANLASATSVEKGSVAGAEVL